MSDRPEEQTIPDNVRDFLNEIASGNYQYLIGRDGNEKLVVKNINNGQFVSRTELLDYLE